MLAERGSGKARAGGLVAEFDHGPQMLAAGRVGKHHASRPRLLVVEGFAEIVHRGEADIAAAEPVDPFRLAALGEDALEELHHRALMRARPSVDLQQRTVTAEAGAE